MKNLKFLFTITLITFTIKLSGIDASIYSVTNIKNLAVPSHNGSANTSWINIGTDQMASHHKINNVRVNDELDVRVEKNNGIVGDWKILKNKATTVLTNNSSNVALYMQGGKFRIHFDSRWYYTKSTTISSAHWYLES